MKRANEWGIRSLLVAAFCLFGMAAAVADNDQRSAQEDVRDDRDRGKSIHGKGTRNFIAKFKGRTTIRDSAIYEEDGHVGINTSNPKAPLEVVSQFVGGGPTLVIGNSHSPGESDVAMDFEAAGELFGNIAMTELGMPGGRLMIMQNNPSGANVTLLEEGSGLVGIGTPYPQAGLHINFGGTSDRDEFLIGDLSGKGFRVRDSGSAIDLVSIGVPLYVNSDQMQPTYLNPFGGIVAIGTDMPTNNILTVVQNSATDPIADAWTVYSSRKLKTNIAPIDGALTKVQSLRGVVFDWKNNGHRDIGLIGEEVGEVVPEVVAYEDNGTDARSVDYSRLVALLIEAVKEQQVEIDGLRADVEWLTENSGERTSYQSKVINVDSY